MTLICIWWCDSSPEALGNMDDPFIAITPGSTLTGVVVPVRVPSMDQRELFYYLLRIMISRHLKPYSCKQIIHNA